MAYANLEFFSNAQRDTQGPTQPALPLAREVGNLEPETGKERSG